MYRTLIAGLTLAFVGVFVGAAPGVAAPGSGAGTAALEGSVSQISGAGLALANPQPTVTITPIDGTRCNVKVGSSATGGMLCSNGYTRRLVVWPDGRWELFIIGWDRAMWHIYQPSATSTGWSSWQSMGGGFTVGPYVTNTAPLEVAGNGLAPNQSKYYCKQYSGGWTANWYECSW
jgi:hypothetical protein